MSILSHPKIELLLSFPNMTTEVVGVHSTHDSLPGFVSVDVKSIQVFADIM